MNSRAIHLLLTGIAFLALPVLFAACGDYEYDGSFQWGSGSAASASSLGWIGSGGSSWNTSHGTASGTNTWSFNDPRDVYVAGNGDVYVADTYNHRICRWSIDASYSEWIGGGADGWKTSDGPAPTGLSPHHFNSPMGVWVFGNYIYVSDHANHRVCRWTLDGEAAGWCGDDFNGWQTGDVSGFSSDEYCGFQNPRGLMLTMWNNYLYVADSQNHRISRWDLDGWPQGWIGDGSNGWQMVMGASASSDQSSFNLPQDVYLHVSGSPASATLYIADQDNERIVRWTESGNSIDWIGGGGTSWQTGSGTGAGSGIEYFSSPSSVFVAKSDNVFVADYWNNRICCWDPTGSPLGWLGDGVAGWNTYNGTGSWDHWAAFDSPMGLCLARGELFVADTGNNRVSRWALLSGSGAWDFTPPDAITNLSASVSGPDVILSWTAVGDDGQQGTAQGYAIRYRSTPIISEGDFYSATPYHGNWWASSPGSGENIVLMGLMGPATYHFAVKTIDWASNRSGVSNDSGSVTIP
jgi:sugar lactone lactonase YvrE